MKFIKYLLSIIVIVLILSLIINGYVITSTKGSINKNIDNYDYILVLGASVKNKKPSLMLEDRLKKALDLYNGNNLIVLSGDHEKKDYDEVTIMKEYLLANDIPEEAIILDEYGISTYDSIYRLKNNLNINKVVIVTQKYHLYRALYIAKKLNVEAIGIPADNIRYRGQKLRDIREYLARIKDFFKVIFKPESVY